MSLLIYIHFAAIVLYVYWFGLLTAQRVQDPVNQALRLFVIFAAGWAVVEVMLYFPFGYGNEVFFKRLTGAFWAPLTFAFLRFLYVLLNRKRDWIYYFLGGGVLLSAVLFVTTGLGIVGFARHEWGVVSINGPYHPYLTIFSVLTGVVALAMGLSASRNPRLGELRRPLRLIVTGAFFSMVFGFTANLVIPDFFNMSNFPRLGFAAVIPLFLFMHRAIIRHKFLAVDVEQLAEELFEGLKDGVILVDRNGGVRRMNDVARGMFGVELGASGLKAKDIIEDYDPNDRERTREIKIERGGEDRYALMSSSPNLLEGVVMGQLIILRDITAQKAADDLLEFKKERLRQEVERQRAELQQARKAERVGIAAGVIAHDFNNILVGIIGYSTVAKDELPEDSALRVDFEEILKAGRRAREIVGHILVFSRRGEEKWELLNIRDELQAALKLLEISLPVNIELALDLREDPGLVFAAPTRLRQIVMNISTNAYQAMKMKGGRLSVTLAKRNIDADFAMEHRLSPRSTYAEISIADTGEGLTGDQIANIFEPFYTTREEDGTGLGLPTALRVASEIGGVIVGDGEPGKGCTFKVYLPLWENSPEERANMATPATLMVVDDDETVGLLCRRLLEPFGYKIVTYLDPVQALRDVTEAPNQYDLLITDQRMPEMSGIDLSKRVLGARPDMPILMFSSRGPASFQADADALGIQEIIQKPLAQDKLQAAIQKALGGG